MGCNPRAWSRMLSPVSPQILVGDLQPRGDRPDRLEIPGRIAGVTRGRLQAGEVRLPEAVELAHEQLAQVFTDHRRQGDAELFAVRPRLEGQLDRPARPEDPVGAALR